MKQLILGLLALITLSASAQSQQENVDLDTELSEVVVKATRIKMAYRDDTLVFDASAFKLPDGSMLDALIRQMPGVKLDDNGVITVNGRKVDYLMLNGKDFFKGDSKVLLDNLPSYTVKNIMVYDRTTDKSRFMGKDIEQKEFVMDVSLKRKYNYGFLGNATVGGGTGDHYMARLFASYFSDFTDVSVYSGVNNINVSGNPNSQGNWNSASTTEGHITHRNAGVSVRRNSKDKKRENITSVQAAWTDKSLVSSTYRENFLSSGTAYNLADSHNAGRNRSLALTNEFRIMSPFWLQSHTRIELSDVRNDVRSRQASFDKPVFNNDEPSSVLDSVFASSRPSGLTQALVNRTFSETLTRGNKFYAYQNLEFNSKLPWGDNIEFQAMASYTRNDSKGHQDYRLDYTMPAVPDYRLVYNHQPTHSSYLYGRSEYYLNLSNHWTYRFYSLYEWQNMRQPRDYYRLDRLEGWDSGLHPLTHLPSADSLRQVLSPDDSHYQRVTSGKWNSGFNIYLQKETDSTYLWLRFHLPVMRINERVAYRKAELDTVVTRSHWLANGNINFNYKWKKKQNSVWANLWHNTIQPTITDYVVFDRSNPLIVTLQADKLKNVEKWETSMGIRLTTRGSLLNFYAETDYAHTANPITLGFSYDPVTGGYTYQCTNAHSANSGKVFAQVSGQKGHWAYELGCRIEQDKGQTVELDADMQGKSLYDFRRTNIAPSVAIAFQQQAFLVRLSAAGAYERNTFDNVRQTNYHNKSSQVSLYAQYTLPVVNVQLLSDLSFVNNSVTLSSVPTRNSWLWNVSLTRSFLKDKRLIIALVAVDILRNVSDYSYTANAFTSSFTRTATQRIGRMLMLSAAYNISKR